MTEQIIVRKSDSIVLYRGPNAPLVDLTQHPIHFGSGAIADNSINAGTCIAVQDVTVPADFQVDWYTYTFANGWQITPAGTAGQQSAAAAAIGAYKAAAIASIGDPRNPAPGTMLGNRLASPLMVTVEGGAHPFTQDQISEVQVAMMGLRGLVSVTNAKPWPVSRKIMTADAVLVVVTAQDMIDIGVVMADYVWDQKQYAAETIAAILQPSVTTTAAVDAIVNAMVWLTS